MFECSACTLRAIRSIAAETLSARRPTGQLLLTPRLTRRRASTAVASSTNPGEPYLNAAQLRHQNAKEGSLIRKHDADDGLPIDTLPPRDGKAAQDRALRKELEWLPDPLKLAEHIAYTLRCEKPDKALDLVRLASKDRDCGVSWNHIVDWHMRTGKVGEALKIYQEMKKRAQFPDAYTYTILLRGLMGIQTKDKKAPVPEEHVSKAVSLYHSMSSPTSRVKPTIIHTNAALKVCAFGHDMDAFWGIAGKIPENGAGAADHVTYSIIFNAIRHEAVRDVVDEGNASNAKGEKAVNEGRKVWQEVIQKWRAGQVKVDEELVCAMARVLLVSARLGDWDDVLSLVQQTMQINRLIAAYGSPERNTAHVPQAIGDQDSPSALTPSEQEDHDGFVDAPAAKAFKPVHPLPPDPNKPKRPLSLAYAAPGNDTLSVLIDACTRLRAPKTAGAYWDLLTGPEHNIKPDILNFHAFLRALYHSRASTRATRLLTDDLQRAVIPMYNMTFRYALEVCARDWKNPNVMDNATKILDVMEKHQSDIDIASLKKYISLALNTDNGPKIVAALDRLDKVVHALRSRVTHGTDSKVMKRESHLFDRKQTLSFLQVMVGAMDTLMSRGLVAREAFQHWHARRSSLNQFITRAMKGIERTERDLGKAVHVPALKNAGGEGLTMADLDHYGLRRGMLPSSGRDERAGGDGRRALPESGKKVRGWGDRKALSGFKRRGKVVADGDRGKRSGGRGGDLSGRRRKDDWGTSGARYGNQKAEDFADSPADFGM